MGTTQHVVEWYLYPHGRIGSSTARTVTAVGDPIGAIASRRALLTLAQRAAARHGGSLLVDEGGVGGRRLTVDGGPPAALVQVHDRRAYAAVLRRGSVGLAQSYADGWWDADDLTEMVRSALTLSAGFRQRLDSVGRWAAGAVGAVRRRAAPGTVDDRANIAAHYDLSNDLFTLMLDPTMAYSCAFFERPSASLEEAQRAKFDRLATKLGVTARDRVVEIGTGWGGFAAHLAERYGCHVTTTTISEAQRAYATKLVAERGLSERVSVLGEHYRNLTGTYDVVVSVEMIEAVDWRRHDEFFACCAGLLAPAGRMGLQAITIADQSFERAKQHQDFIRKLIFPGGCIPSVASIAASVARATDLRIVDLEDIGAHYPETLRRWRANLAAHRDDVAALGFDERFWRLWNLYLSYCEAAFIERHISDVQITLTGPAWRPFLAAGER